MSTQPNDDAWLETDMDAEQATGSAAAALLDSVAQTLDEAPEDRRYDVTLVVTERGSQREEFDDE